MTTDNLPSTTAGSDALLAKLDNLPALSVDDVIERTLTRALSAGTAEEVLSNPEAMGLRDLVGQTVIVNGIDGWLPSDIKGGLGRYVVLSCTDPETGERFTATTGSPYVITRALRLAELDALPQLVRVVELESKSNPNQSSLWIVAAKPAPTAPAANGAASNA